MSRKPFLIPVSSAVAALLPAGVHAVPTPDQPHPEVQRDLSSVEISGAQDPIIRTIQYFLGSETHTLLLRQTSGALLYAGHGSHSSHRSHGSHRSGY